MEEQQEKDNKTKKKKSVYKLDIKNSFTAQKFLSDWTKDLINA